MEADRKIGLSKTKTKKIKTEKIKRVKAETKLNIHLLLPCFDGLYCCIVINKLKGALVHLFLGLFRLYRMIPPINNDGIIWSL